MRHSWAAPAVVALLGAAAALLGAAAGLAVHAVGSGGAVGVPLCALVVAFCCARAGEVPAGEAGVRRASGVPLSTVRQVADRAVRLSVAFFVHPALTLAFLPLCRTVPAQRSSALTGGDADAARAVRRIVRAATEDAWTGPYRGLIAPLLLRHHTRFSSRVAAATARGARRSAGAALRARLPLLCALSLSTVVLSVAGAQHNGTVATAVTVFLTVVTTPTTPTPPPMPPTPLSREGTADDAAG